MVLEGSHDRITRELGWEPEIKFEKTLRDLFEFWLAMV
jgi:nucleoside-diphosphate-sugar epimerase